MKKKDEKVAPTISQSGDVQKIRDALNAQLKANVAKEVKERPTIVLSSGILSMDLAVSNGGLVLGRVMDIFGWEGTGKTLMCMTIGGYIQRCTKLDKEGKTVNRVVAFLDAEGTFSKNFAASAGLNTDELILVQSTPEKIISGEEYFDIMATLIGLGTDYVILDSCPALNPSQVMMNATGQGQKSPLGQLMSSGLNKITPIVNANGQTLVHFINQKRGRPMSKPWESSETETGGNALKFYSSYRFEVVHADDILKNVLGADGVYREKKVGVTSKVRIIKNKTAPIPPYLPSSNYHFEFDVYFEPFKDETGMEYHRGVDVTSDFAAVGVRTGVIKQGGSWFTFGDIKAAGMAALIQKIREHPEVMNDIRNEVFNKMGVTAKPVIQDGE